MPLVKIHLLAGKSPTFHRSIADGVHQALHETYDVPADDRFQIVHLCGPDELIFNAGYLDVERTREIVIIEIVASRTRSLAQKKDLYAAVARNLARDPGLRPQDVQIILTANEREDWSFGNGIASYVPNA